MGTIAIGALDIGAMVIGGLVAKFLPKVVSAVPGEALTDAEKARIKESAQTMIDGLQQIVDAL